MNSSFIYLLNSDPSGAATFSWWYFSHYTMSIVFTQLILIVLVQCWTVMSPLRQPLAPAACSPAHEVFFRCANPENNQPGPAHLYPSHGHKNMWQQLSHHFMDRSGWRTGHSQVQVLHFMLVDLITWAVICPTRGAGCLCSGYTLCSRGRHQGQCLREKRGCGPPCLRLDTPDTSCRTLGGSREQWWKVTAILKQAHLPRASPGQEKQHPQKKMTQQWNFTLVSMTGRYR